MHRVRPASKEVGKRPSLIRNVFSNWVGFASAVLYALLITPVVIRALDREAYGIWSFLNAFVAYSSLFYLGLGAALVKYVAQHYAVGDRRALNRLVSVVLTIYTGLGLAALSIGILAAPYVPDLLLSSPSRERSAVVSLTVIVLAIRVCLMFVGSVFSGVLVAQGRTDLYIAVPTCGHAVRLLLVPLSLRQGDPLLGLAVVVGVTGALEVLAMVIVARREDPDLRCRIVRPLAPELRMLYGFGLLAFVLQVADRLISYTDTTVIGLMLGAGDVALYVLPLQLAEYGRYVVVGIVSVMLPHLTTLQVTGRSALFRSSYQRTLKITALVAVFVNVNLVFLGAGFLRLWVGPAFADDAFPILLALGIASLAQSIAVHSQTPFCLALGRVRFAAIVLVAEGLTNVALSVTFARPFGITGVAIATAIPAVVISGSLLPIYVARLVGAPLRTLLRQVVLPVGTFMSILTAGHVLLWLSVPGDSSLSLGAKFCGGGVIAVVTGWKVASDSERRFVRAVVMRQRQRRRDV